MTRCAVTVINLSSILYLVSLFKHASTLLGVVLMLMGIHLRSLLLRLWWRVVFSTLLSLRLSQRTPEPGYTAWSITTRHCILQLTVSSRSGDRHAVVSIGWYLKRLD